MIRLTRLRNPNPLYINPDLIERLDSHHETTVHLSNGSEYVVTEHPDAIVRLIHESRAGVLALALRLERDLPLPAAALPDADRNTLRDAGEPTGSHHGDDGDAPWKPTPPADGPVDTAAANEGR